MAARDIIKGDIINISYLLLPVGRNMPDNLKEFNARAYLVQPSVFSKDVFPYSQVIPEGDRKDWLEVWWEQRSANRKGVVIVPPLGTPPEVTRKLPRVRLVKRPR